MSKKDQKKEILEEEPEITEIDSLREELDATKDLLLRTAAEYDNFRKRTQKEKEIISQDSIAFAVGKLLPIIDSLENAVKSDESSTAAELIKGIELIYNQASAAFNSLGAAEVSGVNEPFDPETQHAVSHIESDEFGENTVSLVMQKGYKIGDKVIRPAMVQVAN